MTGRLDLMRINVLLLDVTSLQPGCILRVSYRIFGWGGESISASTKHGNVRGLGASHFPGPPEKFWNLASLAKFDKFTAYAHAAAHTFWEFHCPCINQAPQPSKFRIGASVCKLCSCHEQFT